MPYGVTPLIKWYAIESVSKGPFYVTWEMLSANLLSCRIPLSMFYRCKGKIAIVSEQTIIYGAPKKRRNYATDFKGNVRSVLQTAWISES
jgi:hypothetical protein